MVPQNPWLLSFLYQHSYLEVYSHHMSKSLVKSLCWSKPLLQAWTRRTSVFFGCVGSMQVFRDHAGHCFMKKNIVFGYTLWLFNSLPWKITIFKNGKPSISVGHFPWLRYINNQRVIGIRCGENWKIFMFFFSNQQDDMGEIQISGDNFSRGLKINHHIP